MANAGNGIVLRRNTTATGDGVGDVSLQPVGYLNPGETLIVRPRLVDIMLVGTAVTPCDGVFLRIRPTKSFSGVDPDNEEEPFCKDYAEFLWRKGDSFTATDANGAQKTETISEDYDLYFEIDALAGQPFRASFPCSVDLVTPMAGGYAFDVHKFYTSTRKGMSGTVTYTQTRDGQPGQGRILNVPLGAFAFELIAGDTTNPPTVVLSTEEGGGKPVGTQTTQQNVNYSATTPYAHGKIIGLGNARSVSMVNPVGGQKNKLIFYITIP